MTYVRDLQHHIQIGGRMYVIELCAPGTNPTPVQVGPFDVHIMADVPVGFADHDGVEPEVIVRHVIDYLKPLVPASITPEQWSKFADVVLAWVCAHREALASFFKAIVGARHHPKRNAGHSNSPDAQPPPGNLT